MGVCVCGRENILYQKVGLRVKEERFRSLNTQQLSIEEDRHYENYYTYKFSQ